jgi:hypothetical protein
MVWVDSPGWSLIENEQYRQTPIRAPDGANKAAILIRLRDTSAGYSPQAEVDDVELVQQPD